MRLGVYVLCGDRLLVVIYRDFSWKLCSFFVVVFICLSFLCVTNFPLVFLVVYGVVAAYEIDQKLSAIDRSIAIDMPDLEDKTDLGDI
jgi:hypothetical protein